MSDLDLTRYEGHTRRGHLGCQQVDPCDAAVLLAEVRRLREELADERIAHNVCLKIHRGCDSCLQAEEKLTALRQSHARLLAASKQVDNWMVPRCICRPGAKCLGCELRAAVAEAEALNAE